VTLTMAEMTLRGLLRRRGSLLLMVALPLAFYVARHELVGQSIRFLAFGLAWAVSTLALFAALDARQTEARLVVGGWTRRALVGGRVLALLIVGAALTAAYLVLILVDDRPVANESSIALLLGATAVIAIALGTMLGALVARELEGALALFIVAGLQFVADPASALARVLPFWSTREFGTYAIDGGTSVAAGAAHAAAVVAIAAAVISARGARSR
jgi:hypothetical protein